MLSNKYPREFWARHAHLSGEQFARVIDTDGGSARALIRKAKADKNLCDLWGIDPETLDVENEVDDTLRGFDLLLPPDVGPAILVYDIENSPNLAWVWGAYDQNVIAMEQDWYMLSFAYKWLNTDKIGFVSIFQDPEFVTDTDNDRYVAERLAALFDRADTLVAHNGDKFDRRKSNQRFLYWGIDPPSPYTTIDTLKVAKREFAHASNALKELGRVHELGDKTHHTGFELWRECMKGNPTFWAVMEKYNRQDVVLLEQVYTKLLPWVNGPGKANHLNFGFWYKGEMVCPTCGHDKLTQKGTHRTLVSEFPSYQCDRCRSFSRFRTRTPQTSDTRVQLV